MLSAFELSPDTRALADRLATVAYDAMITHDDLSRVIGRKISTCRHLLYAAMRLVRKEQGAIFASVRGVGYKRLTVAEAPSIGHTARKRIRAQSRRATRNISVMLSKPNDVPNGVLLKANRELSVLGLLEIAAQDRNLPAGDQMKDRPLPVAMATRALLDKLGGAASDDVTDDV
jgi:hypothetical protein